jgi:hypothetical protein
LELPKISGSYTLLKLAQELKSKLARSIKASAKLGASSPHNPHFLNSSGY